MMSNTKKTSAWNIVFHYAAFLFSVINGVALVPLILSYIGSNVYGLWLAASSVLAWIGIVDPGISLMLQQKIAVAYGANSKAEVGSIVSIAVYFSGALLTLSLILCFIVSINLNVILGSAIFGIPDLPGAFILAAVGAAFSIGSYSITAINLGLQGSLGPGLIYVGTQSIALIFTIVGFNYGFGLYALAGAMVLRGGIGYLGSLCYLRWRINKDVITQRGNLGKLKEFISLGGYTSLARCADLLVTQVETVVIARFFGGEAVSSFLLTKKGPELVRMLSQRPAHALLPVFAHLMGSGGSERLRELIVNTIIYGFVMSGLLFCGFCVLNAPFMNLWVGLGVFSGQSVNFCIVCNAVVGGMVGLLSIICQGLGDFKASSLVGIMIAITSTILLILAALEGSFMLVALSALPPLLFIGLIYFSKVIVNVADLKDTHIKKLIWAVLHSLLSTLIVFQIFEIDESLNWFKLCQKGVQLSIVYLGIVFIINGSIRLHLVNVARNIFRAFQIL